jgi:4-aminobutyrate aminotransferase/(S)-3-amino-2-methylpropionate transaminase
MDMARGSGETVPIPGPKSQELMARRNRVVARGPSHATPIFAARAEGARIWDVDGNVYIDFAGGIGVQNLGHRPAEVVAAARQQLDHFIHTSWNVVLYEPYVEVCELLTEMTPGSFPKKAILVNSGAEAVENAVKIARAYTGRPAIVAMHYGFHGRTLLTMTLTGKVAPYRKGFGPFAPEVYHIPYAYPYRDPLGTRPDFGRRAAERLLDLFETVVPAEEVAAVIVEPVAGEGGFIVPPPDFLPTLRAITEARGILLIADEIQSGLGRTGRLFAVEHSRVVPDLICVAKSLAAGFPLSAVVGRAEVMDAPEVGGLGGTYAGNPVACAAAAAVLRRFQSDPDLLVAAERLGQRILARFHDMAERHPSIGDVRGLGPMAAIELVSDRERKTPGGELAQAVNRYAYEHGLILMRAGMASHVIRTLMPLVISDEELEEGLDILDAAIGDAEGRLLART